MLTNNITKLSRKKSDIKYIVVHYTANYNIGANKESHYKYFNNPTAKASADVVIDSKGILKINDWYKSYCWHVGDGKGKYGITNSNSIGIELCVNKDGILSETIKKCENYIVDLLKKEFTNLSLKDIVRHYDASRKLCPAFFVDLTIKGYNKAYTDFRKNIESKLSQTKDYKTILKEVSNYSEIWVSFVKAHPEVNLSGLIEMLYYYKSN